MITEFGFDGNRDGPVEERGTYAFQAELGGVPPGRVRDQAVAVGRDVLRAPGLRGVPDVLGRRSAAHIRRSTRRAWSTSTGTRSRRSRSCRRSTTPRTRSLRECPHWVTCASTRVGAPLHRARVTRVGHSSPQLWRAGGAVVRARARPGRVLASRFGVVHHRITSHSALRPPRGRRRAAGPVRRLGDAGSVRRHPRGAHRGPARRRGVRRLAHGPGRDDAARRRSSSSSGWSRTTCAGCPRAAPSTACCVARTAACSTTCSSTASPTTTFLTVTNAANHEKDLAWLQSHAGEFDVDVLDRHADFAMLAVQGPQARGARRSGSPTAAAVAHALLRAHGGRAADARVRDRLHGRGRCRVAARPADAPKVWDALIAGRRHARRARRARHAAPRGRASTCTATT